MGPRRGAVGRGPWRPRAAFRESSELLLMVLRAHGSTRRTAVALPTRTTAKEDRDEGYWNSQPQTVVGPSLVPDGPGCQGNGAIWPTSASTDGRYAHGWSTSYLQCRDDLAGLLNQRRRAARGLAAHFWDNGSSDQRRQPPGNILVLESVVSTWEQPLTFALRRRYPVVLTSVGS
jgi:hypothetical protein